MSVKHKTKKYPRHKFPRKRKECLEWLQLPPYNRDPGYYRKLCERVNKSKRILAGIDPMIMITTGRIRHGNGPWEEIPAEGRGLTEPLMWFEDMGDD